MKCMKKEFSLVILLLLVFCAGEKETKNEIQEGLTKKELLGKKIFFVPVFPSFFQAPTMFCLL